MGKSSSSVVAPVLGLAWAFLALPVVGIGAAVAFLLSEHGVL